MARGALPLLLLCLIQTGLSELIQTQQTVKAALGEDAHFNCQLTQSKNVLQVTWQKVLPDGKKDLATYSERFPPRVNPPFEGKVEFQSAGLQSCSIVIRRVTKQDESCYRCLFHTVPHGALPATTCLTVYEQYEPVLHVSRSNSSAEPLVSCSATGRPAPAVTLIVPGRDLSSSQNNTVSVHNPNGTVTVTATALLSGFHGNGTQVECVVQHFSGAVMKVFQTIPENNTASTAGVKKQLIVVERRFRASIIGVVALAALILLIAAVVFSILPKQRNREPEKPQETEVP